MENITTNFIEIKDLQENTVENYIPKNWIIYVQVMITWLTGSSPKLGFMPSGESASYPLGWYYEKKRARERKKRKGKERRGGKKKKVKKCVGKLRE